MSEKIYAWLLRLFPSRFREAYGEEALALFRDRCRDERGFLLRFRLWVDLLGDLAWSVPRAYFRVQPELTSYAAHVRAEGVPALLLLPDESLGAGTLSLGGVLTLAATIAFSLLLHHGAKHLPLSALIHPARSTADHRSSPFPRQPRELARDSQARAIAPAGGQPEMAATSRENSKPNKAELHGPTPPDALRPGKTQGGQPRPSSTAVLTGASLNRAERQRVIAAVVANLKKHYLDPVVAQKMADALREQEKKGADDAATDGKAFADLLTRQMRDLSHDRHLELLYSEAPLPEPAATPAFEARYRKAMEQANCTFEPVEILPHHIGYLKFDSFPDPSVCRQTAAAAMASLNKADAIIFDLRDNRGGYPSMVMLIAAYLFDHPEYMYNPRQTTTEDCWTGSPVLGSRLADKPVYLLTSARTFSGAEHFSYDLKMLKRATVVGEKTGGATDVGTFHRLDDHFGIGIPETRAINPYREPDWAGIGVEPDVKSKAADALELAVKLAERQLQKK